MENIPIKPLADKVLIKPLEIEESSHGRIIIPDMGKEKPDFGLVLDVGPGRYNNDGVLIPMTIEVGKTVIMPKYGANTVEVENEEYILVSESEILGYLN